MVISSQSTRRQRVFAPARGVLSAGAAVALAVALLWPVQVDGYAFLGGSLDLTQRDLRVFNNFTDAAANDNTRADPDFPGAIGAPLAVWKGALDWSSELHNTGYGDPHQPGDLGSGGANFDPVWQGLATSVGGPNDNIVSEISGSAGGVYGFTEIPLADGWRIRFYEEPTILHDGPGRFPQVAPNMDLQGILTHEYGHALGLAHSNNGFATMLGAAEPSTILSFRSIADDDRAGVQALYGVRAANKPHIATYALSAGTLTISGQHFSLAGNEVWFTNGAATADGTPLKVAGLASQNGGTEITLAIPIDAVTGDVLVKSADSGGASLSNPFPFDPTVEPCAVPLSYGNAKLTSIGTLPVLAPRGRPHVSTQDLEITLTGAIANTRGVVYFGNAPAAAPMLGGTRLVARPLVRLGFFLTDSLGEAAVRVPIAPAMAGSTRYYQAAFQDHGDAFGVGLSDAVEIRFCP